MAGPLRDDEGEPVDAAYALAAQGSSFDITLESRGGSARSGNARNTRYHDGLELLLRRAGGLGATLVDAEVASREAELLSPADRRLLLQSFSYPVPPERLIHAESLRLELARAQRTIGQSAGSIGGNTTKRIRMTFELPASMELEELDHRLANSNGAARQPMNSTLKYDALKDYLAGRTDDEIILSLAQIRELVGDLPKEAGKPQFWANTRGHHESRRNAWLDNGYRAHLRAKEHAVAFRRDSDPDWSTAELQACVEAYRRLTEDAAAGRPINKSELRRAVVADRLINRSEGAYERRMQNISAVLEELGIKPLAGYLPAANVGRHKKTLIALINAAWSRSSTPEQPTADPTDLETRTTAALLKLEQKPDGPPPKGNRNVTRAVAATQRFVRDPDVAAWVLRTAAGYCEVCGDPAPFLRRDGSAFLEVHHLRPLAEGGPDTTCNTLAACPNCHRKLHYSPDRSRLRTEVLGRLPRLRSYPQVNTAADGSNLP